MTIEERFRFFVEHDVGGGNSELYRRLGERMQDDAPLLAILPDDINPVHLFAVINHLGGMTSDYDAFRSFLVDRQDEILLTMATTGVQTNEIGRCAVFLPALAAIEGPIALVECGASAGLNLNLDRYAYDYGTGRLGDSDVVVRCEPRGDFAMPARIPEIVWRQGIDRNPIDVNDDRQVGWLESCVFADNHDRIERLRGAVAMARADPPPVLRGDIVDEVADVVASAPSGTTVVVMHSAVLPYLERERVRAFRDIVLGLDVVWLSIEAWWFIRSLREQLTRESLPVSHLLGRNGTEPLAFAHPHGRWIEWIGPPVRPIP